jgi:dipeptidase
MALYRETYEGTDFDMTKGVVMARSANKQHPADTVVSPIANPWLTTTMRNTLNTIAPGTVAFRRTVAVAWCAYSHVIQLRNWLPDSVGGVCWLSLDNPGQSPRIPVFCGTTALPKAYETCGQKQYVPDCALWQFRRANKLATLSWQSTKKGFNKEILALETLALDGAPTTATSSAALNAYTEYIYQESVRRWKALEEKYWLQFGLGF